MQLTYGAANSLDDRLSRLAGVQSGGQWQARFFYLGLGRQVARSAGPVTGGYGDLSNGTFTGLDRYGPVVDLTYRGYDALNRPLPGLPQFEYGYDARGNRTFARREAGPQARSWRYGYDGLNRLVHAEWGPLNAAGDGFDGTSIPEAQAWFLDDLGNWAGPEEAQEGLPEAAGRLLFADSNGDGVYDPAADSLQRWERHEANEVNELAAVTTGFTPEDEGETQAFAHDAAGNLVFDAQHYYVYDAWNRLVALHQIGTVTVGTNGIEGEPGPVEARYAYDALGRRVRAEACHGSIETPTICTVTRHVYGSGPEVLAEYDINSNGQETIQRWFIHGPAYPDPLVMVDRTLAGAQPATSAEYFYYLKDVLGSVVALIDTAGAVVERYDYDPYGQPRVLVGLQGLAPAALHDADGDGLITDADAAALAACGTNGADDPACVALHDLTADGRVDGVDVAAFNAVYQPGEEVGVPLEWEPIGEPIGEVRPPIEEPWPRFRSPVGNPYRWTGQRYDTATALYLFHARTYSAAYGRFMQRDPMGALNLGGGEPGESHGGAAYAKGVMLNAADAYFDSLNLYEYASASPTSLTDPLGRFSLPELNAAAGLSTDLDANNADTAMSMLRAFRGVALYISMRNLMLEGVVDRAAAEANLADMDSALNIYQTYQQVQLARFGVSLIRAGVELARAGVVAFGNMQRGLLTAAATHRHHIYPKQFDWYFEPRRIDINNYTVNLEQKVHLSGVHGRGGFTTADNLDLQGHWNQKWQKFIDDHPNATPKEVYQFGGQLMDDFGLSGLPIEPY